jgi:peroxiredoxin
MADEMSLHEGGWIDRWVLGTVALVIAIALTFLLIGRAPTTSKRSGGQQGTFQAQALQNGKAPPEIAAAAFDGTPVRLSSLKGKVVLVNFFASWCAECRAEIADIEKTYQAKHAAGFEVIGINAWENGDGRAFLRELGGTYPALPDPQPAANRPGAIARSYGLDTQALPVSVFIDRSGRVHQVYPGRIDAGNIMDELRKLGIS